MPAFPEYAGTPRAGQPFRQRRMPGGPGLARIRAGTYRPWGHPLAKKEDGLADSGTQGREMKNHVHQHLTRCSIRRLEVHPSHLGIHELSR
jgi:hypothetical protein